MGAHSTRLSTQWHKKTAAAHQPREFLSTRRHKPHKYNSAHDLSSDTFSDIQSCQFWPKRRSPHTQTHISKHYARLTLTESGTQDKQEGNNRQYSNLVWPLDQGHRTSSVTSQAFKEQACVGCLASSPASTPLTQYAKHKQCVPPLTTFSNAQVQAA